MRVTAPWLDKSQTKPLPERTEKPLSRLQEAVLAYAERKVAEPNTPAPLRMGATAFRPIFIANLREWSDENIRESICHIKDELDEILDAGR